MDHDANSRTLNNCYKVEKTTLEYVNFRADTCSRLQKNYQRRHNSQETNTKICNR